MALSPSLTVVKKYDGFRIPVAAGTTFNAGDVVPVGASLVGVADVDYNWQGSTSSSISLNAVGIYTVPKLTAEAIAAGVKLGWNSTSTIATATPTSAGSTVSQYPLGISVAAATTSVSTVDVMLWPGSGLGS